MQLNLEKRSHERILLLILAAVQFAHITDFMMLMPLGARLLEQLNITPTQFGILVSSYTFSAGIAGFAGAFFLDRIGRKLAISVAQAGFTLGTLLCALSTDYETFLVMRIITGIFGGMQSALLLAIIGDVIPFDRRGAAMGLVMAAFSIAAVLGVPAGLYLANKFDWHFPFFCLAAFGGVVSIVIFIVLPSLKGHLQKGPGQRPWQMLKENLSDKNKVMALLLISFIMLGFFPILPYITPYLEQNVGIAADDIPYIYLLGGALTIFTSRIIGGLADRYGKKQVLTACTLITAIPVYLLTNLWPTTLFVVLCITGILFIAANGRFVTVMSLITSVASMQTRGSYMSLNSAVQQFAAALASFIGGLLVSQGADQKLSGFAEAGYLAIVFVIPIIVVAWRIKPVDD